MPIIITINTGGRAGLVFIQMEEFTLIWICPWLEDGPGGFGVNSSSLTPIEVATTPPLSSVLFHLYGEYRKYWLMRYEQIGGEWCANIRLLNDNGVPYSPVDSREFSCILTVRVNTLYVDFSDIEIDKRLVH